ncbi:hypothetical protein FRC08_018231 [Ceratobasidium sp. 394]|nr:hypothetical protein FRC08_018231 [Ceratobasidium sp. 394]
MSLARAKSSQQPTVITSTFESTIEPRRFHRARRPSIHKLESDEYEASSRASTPAPSASKPNGKPSSKKRRRGKPGDRPGQIVQPDFGPWPTSHEGSPEPPSEVGSNVSNSRLASPSPAGHKASAAVDRAEAVRRASAYLGTDASRYSNATLQKVIDQIEASGEEAGSGPMEIETGSAPTLGQSAGRLGLESRHQSPAGRIADASSVQGAKEHNSPRPEQLRLVPPADNSDTEPESESEVVELGPGDSVSQRIPPIPQTSSHSSRNPVPHAPKRKANMHMGSDTNTENESDTEPEDETVRSLKRLRITPPSLTHVLPTRPDQSHSRRHQSLPQRRSSHPQRSSALPAAPASPKLRTATTNTSSRTSSSHSLQGPPPVSNLGAVLDWASRFAKQAGTSHHVAPAVDYQLLATVLDNTRCSHLDTSASEPAPSRPRRAAGLAEDNAAVLEAEAALTLGKQIHPRHKATLADFPGFPRNMATMAIPKLNATAVTEGVYESHEVQRNMATKCYNERWALELPDVRLQKAPPPLIGLMVHRIPWFRCESKVRVRPVIPPDYVFRNPPRTREDVRYNKRLVKKLLPNTFHCRDLVTDVDPYDHPALAHSIAAAFFWATDSLGMMFHDMFYPMPLPAVAMVLTTMQHCIGEWKTGRYVPKELNVDTQRKMYDAHLAGLLNYGKLKPDELKQHRIDWFCDYAGGTLEDDEPYQAVTWADRVSPDAEDPNDDAEHSDHSSAKLGARTRSSIVTETRRHRPASGASGSAINSRR